MNERKEGEREERLKYRRKNVITKELDKNKHF